MKNKFFFFLLIIVSFKLSSQNNRENIKGKIINEALSTENIHIINKNSGNATISNKHGEFQILVRINDTLIFSGIQFYKKEVPITPLLLKNNSIIIQLFLKINELDEVEVKAHNLSGNLVTDANKVKDSISKVNSLVFDFSMIDFSKPIVSGIDEFSRSRTSSDKQLTPSGNANVIAILGLVLNPLFKEVGKIGKKRRQRKNEERVYQKNAINAPEKMIAEFGETFFTETLKIPSEEIIDFIGFCESKGIISFYIEGKKMEVIDILIKENIVYLKSNKKE